MSRIRLTAVLVVPVVALMLGGESAFAQTVTLSVTVTGSKDGKEGILVPNATVQAINGKGDQLGNFGTTGATGQTTITFDAAAVGTPTYTVLALASGFHVARVQNLTGTELKPKISVGLPNEKGPKQYIDILDQIAVYEFFHQAAAGSKDPASAVERITKLLRPLVTSMPHPLVHTTTATPEQTEVVEKNLTPTQKQILIKRFSALYQLYGIPDPAAATDSIPCDTATLYYVPYERPGCRLFRRR